MDAAVDSGTTRVEVDPARDPVDIPCLILHEIEQHARESHPEECCGLLSGDDEVRFRHLHRCRNEMTPLHQAAPSTHPCDGRYAFHMHPLDYDRAERDAAAMGERITAVYHSHVGARAYFSATDLAFASHPDFPFPDADHIVVAVVDGEVADGERGLFRRDPGAPGFHGHPLRAVPASS